MLEVLYEDNHIIAVVKPRKTLTQGDITGDEDMHTIVKEYIRVKYNKPGEAYLGLVHRLDRPVGGVMIFARTSKAASRISELLRRNSMDKIYLAVVKGTPEKRRDELIDYLYKDVNTNISRVENPDFPGSKKAILNYITIATKENLSLLAIKLETGRSHQIRVQLLNISTPLWGDGKYSDKNKKTDNIALWASMLSFVHPVKKEIITFNSLPPLNEYPWNLFDEKDFDINYLSLFQSQ